MRGWRTASEVVDASPYLPLPLPPSELLQALVMVERSGEAPVTGRR